MKEIMSHPVRCCRRYCVMGRCICRTSWTRGEIPRHLLIRAIDKPAVIMDMGVCG